MPRKPRSLTIPAGSMVHVTNRGNARELVFRADGDRQFFLSLLEEQAASRGWHCDAYCLMDNHYHLLLEAPDGDLSPGMHAVGFRYAQMFNRVYDRVGHVFQGRFRAVVVEHQSHALELVRYIALNPVRAGLCVRAEDWRWSSYSALIRGWRSPPALASDRLLRQFGGSRAGAIAALRAFVEDPGAR